MNVIMVMPQDWFMPRAWFDDEHRGGKLLAAGHPQEHQEPLQF